MIGDTLEIGSLMPSRERCPFCGATSESIIFGQLRPGPFADVAERFAPPPPDGVVMLFGRECSLQELFLAETLGLDAFREKLNEMQRSRRVAVMRVPEVDAEPWPPHSDQLDDASGALGVDDPRSRAGGGGAG